MIMKIDENAGPISGPFGCSCLMLFVFYLICVCFFCQFIVLLFPSFLKTCLFCSDTATKTNPDSIQDSNLHVSLVFNLSAIFPQCFLQNQHFLQPICFCLNMFCFYLIIFFLFVCFCHQFCQIFTFFQIKNKSRLNRRLNSGLKSACFLVFCFSAFFHVFLSKSALCSQFVLFVFLVFCRVYVFSLFFLTLLLSLAFPFVFS